VIHYEGKTGGTDTASGVKAWQVVNAKKFFLRWHATLEGHRANGQAPYFERERDVRKRALVIDASAPTPDQDAGSVVTVVSLRLMQRLGYKVHFVPQDNFLFQDGYITDLQRSGIDCAYVPYESDFDSYIQRHGHLFDVVLVFRVTVLEKVIDALRRHAPQAPLLFHDMDLHFLRMRREAELTGDRTALAEADAMERRELAMIARVDCTITPSTYEKIILDRIAPTAPTRVLPFMIDHAGTRVGFKRRRDVCFLGGYTHTPNIDAVKYFVDAIFPLLRAEEPGLRFIIAGAHPTDEVRALACADVIVTGQVPDLRDVFDVVRVFVCPLRAGAGVKGKLLAAMAYGLPVVTTSVGAEGMGLVDGSDVLIADAPADFVVACLRVYRNRALWQALSTAGQAVVQQRHSLAMGRQALEEAIEAGLRHRLDVDRAPTS
jgi:glycosyltransferase involved in cell wall biosynthesis